MNLDSTGALILFIGAAFELVAAVGSLSIALVLLRETWRLRKIVATQALVIAKHEARIRAVESLADSKQVKQVVDDLIASKLGLSQMLAKERDDFALYRREHEGNGSQPLRTIGGK